jgi:hypothetical protein
MASTGPIDIRAGGPIASFEEIHLTHPCLVLNLHPGHPWRGLDDSDLEPGGSVRPGEPIGDLWQRQR